MGFCSVGRIKGISRYFFLNEMCVLYRAGIKVFFNALLSVFFSENILGFCGEKIIKKTWQMDVFIRIL